MYGVSYFYTLTIIGDIENIYRNNRIVRLLFLKQNKIVVLLFIIMRPEYYYYIVIFFQVLYYDPLTFIIDRA